jgi:spore coat protein SA
MKILMICTEKLPVPAVRGGAIQTYIDGVSSLLSKKHDLTILGTPDPSLSDDETVKNIRYVRKAGGLIEIYREGVCDFLKENSFDLIHIFNRPRLVLPVREYAPDAKIVLSMHNDMFKPEKIEYDEGAAAVDTLDKIITVSDYIGTTISDPFPKAKSKLRTIYSGVDIDRFVPPHSNKAKKMRETIRNEHQLSNKKVILFAGRLSPNKGADVLVKAMPELAKEHPNIALVIVGSKWFSVNDVTDYIAYVRALAEKLPIPVINTGFVHPSEIQKWFAAADVFVCPSQWQEPLARVHYEAMASGLPILTTARGGNPEVIIDNENGFVIEKPEDPQSFVKHLSHLLSDPELCKRLGITGRKLAEKYYIWSRVAGEILDVWNEVENQSRKEISTKDMEESKLTDFSNDIPKIPASVNEDPIVEVIEEINEQLDEPRISSEEVVALLDPIEEVVEDLNKQISLPEENSEIESERSELVNQTLKEKPTRQQIVRKLFLSELNKKESLMDLLQSIVEEKSKINTSDASTEIKELLNQLEQSFKDQIDQSPKQKQLFETVNDITTARLFTKSAAKRKSLR